MPFVNTIDRLYNFIGYVVIYAPHRFPREDYLDKEEQMDLDKAFEELRHGITLLHPEIGTPEKIPVMHSILDDAYAAYQAGERKKGAHLVQDFQDMIFKRED